MLLVYMTAPTLQEAEELASHAVEARLAAGVNIIPSMRSIYHWQGQVEKKQEALCIFKTTEEGFPALRAALEARHSYITPCIVALPVTASTQAFAAWVAEECHPLPQHN